MAKATKAKQLIFSLPNRIGLLAKVAAAITEAGMNIEALCVYEKGYGYFMMVTDNNAKAKKVLTKMGAKVYMEDVISLEVSNKVGQLEKVTKIIADAGLDIHFIYGCPAKNKAVVLILKTEDDNKALKLINA